ncbi:MAG: hypothetical protein RR750_03545 [Citrobacter sp.]|jgi:hypothetical protein
MSEQGASPRPREMAMKHRTQNINSIIKSTRKYNYSYLSPFPMNHHESAPEYIQAR